LLTLQLLNTRTMNLEESLEFSLDLSIWLSESRIELPSYGPNIDHQVEQLTVLCYSPLPRNV
jgi:hypothetical protein